MSARYYVLCSDELMDSDPPWPETFHPVERVCGEEGMPGSHWWLFEDTEALEELDGTRVEPILQRADGEVRVVARRPA